MYSIFIVHVVDFLMVNDGKCREMYKRPMDASGFLLHII